MLSRRDILRLGLGTALAGLPFGCATAPRPVRDVLVIGGYGLFGVVTDVTLRLQPRYKVRRLVEAVDADQLMPTLRRRVAAGCRYGDFQYDIDPTSDGYLTRGVLSCYEPVPDATPMPQQQATLSTEDWAELIHLAHLHPGRAYQRYTQAVLSTHGQIGWCDTQQRSIYDPHYHERLDRRTHAAVKATELLTELYVPRDALARFLHDAAELLRPGRAPVIYGNIRLIERDTQTFLAWAREPFACIIFNLHCTHTRAGVAEAKQTFRDLIDLAIRYEGNYYLTYHRWARREQVAQCYPQFAEFIQLKQKYDPQERFQSEWYRHYRACSRR